MKRNFTLTFNDLSFKLNETYLKLISLNVANSCLYENLADKQLRENLSSRIFKRPENGNGKSLEIRAENIVFGLEMIKKTTGKSFEKANEYLFSVNAHVIRTKVINDCFELIDNYIEGLEKEHQHKIKSKLYQEDWFKVLEILRNNAAHCDNFGRQFGESKRMVWKYDTKEEISWGGITIRKNDIGHLIEYDDQLIFSLIKHCIEYFEKNINWINVNK